MAASTQTVGNTYPTLVDVATRLDPDGTIAKVAEVLTMRNPILSDLAFLEGNLPDGHKFTSRTALPSPTWRRFNQGVDPTKSGTDQHVEPCGDLVGMSKVDAKLAKLNGNEGAFRASEDLAFVVGYNNIISQALFYSNIGANPEQFQGLSPRLGSVSASNPATQTGTGPTSTGQLIKADPNATNGATQTSIWAIGWGSETVHGIYPKGSIAGLSHHDMGEQLVPDAANKQFRAWVTEWSWQIGLCVKDYRYIARACNIDTSTWTSDLSAGADLLMALSDLYTAIYNVDDANVVFYMSRQAYNVLSKQYVAREGRVMDYFAHEGKRVPLYAGIPIRFCDALSVAESLVT
jgi:hypothetical protein